jgi:hypothetical protein
VSIFLLFFADFFAENVIKDYWTGCEAVRLAGLPAETGLSVNLLVEYNRFEMEFEARMDDG